MLAQQCNNQPTRTRMFDVKKSSTTTTTTEWESSSSRWNKKNFHELLLNSPPVRFHSIQFSSLPYLILFSLQSSHDFAQMQFESESTECGKIWHGTWNENNFLSDWERRKYSHASSSKAKSSVTFAIEKWGYGEEKEKSRNIIRWEYSMKVSCASFHLKFSSSHADSHSLGPSWPYQKKVKSHFRLVLSNQHSRELKGRRKVCSFDWQHTKHCILNI